MSNHIKAFTATPNYPLPLPVPPPSTTPTPTPIHIFQLSFDALFKHIFNHSILDKTE